MVYIKEFLPNPAGSDKEGEWIRLINTGEETITIGGWRVFDEAEKAFIFDASQQLPAGGELVLSYAQTGITLNNNGETITLINDEKGIVDVLSYSGQASDDEIIVAERFLETTEETLPNQNLKNLALVGQEQFVDSVQVAPFLVAVVLAVTLGVIAGFLGKIMYEK